jgi:hypothetical protein
VDTGEDATRAAILQIVDVRSECLCLTMLNDRSKHDAAVVASAAAKEAWRGCLSGANACMHGEV